MWIFTQTGFLSVVENRADSHSLIVRARAEADIAALADFADQEVVEMLDADYRFRVQLPRVTFATFMREQIAEITYPNFKGRLHEHNHNAPAIEREQFAYRVWQAGCEYQRQVSLLRAD